MMTDTGSVRQRALSGAVVLTSARWIVRSLGLVSTAVLARLIPPSDYGLVTVSMAYIALLESLSSLPVGQALIRTPNSHLLYGTAFTLQLLRSALFLGFALLGAATLPTYLNDPRLGPVLLACAFQPVLSSFQSPRVVEFDLSLTYFPELIRQVGARLASVATTLTIVFVHPTYWALVAGALAGSLAHTTLSYALRPWRPTLSLKGWRHIMTFTGWLTGAHAIRGASEHVDGILVARFLGVSHSAYYGIGRELPTMALDETMLPLQRVLFPTLMTLHAAPTALRRHALDIIGGLSALGFYVAATFAALGTSLVALVYGPSWIAAGPVLSVISLGLGIQAGTTIASPLAMVADRTRLHFDRAVARALIRVPLFIVGAIHFGLLGAAVGYTSGCVVTAVMNLNIIRHVVGLEIIALWRRVLSSALAAAVTYCVLTVATMALPPPASVLTHIVHLVALAHISFITFVCCLFLGWILQNRPPYSEVLFLLSLPAHAKRLVRWLRSVATLRRR